MSKALGACRHHDFSPQCRASSMTKLHVAVPKHDKRSVANDTEKTMIMGVPGGSASSRTPDRMGFNSRSPAPGPGWKISQTTRYNSAMAVGEP